jgi:alpha-galactosidase
MSLWAAFKSPLLMTNVLTKIDPPTLSILQNPAVLAVSQDPSGSSVNRIWRYYVNDIDANGYGEIQLFSGGLAGGDQLVLLLNAGSQDRTMNASLEDIFWEDGPGGTASQVSQSWDVYDLWANRMSNATAAAIINGTASTNSTGAAGPFNATALGGAAYVYSQLPPSNSTALMGSKVGSVPPSGTVKAFVKSHGVAMLRLRAQQQKQKKDEL